MKTNSFTEKSKRRVEKLKCGFSRVRISDKRQRATILRIAESPTGTILMQPDEAAAIGLNIDRPMYAAIHYNSCYRWYTIVFM